MLMVYVDDSRRTAQFGWLGLRVMESSTQLLDMMVSCLQQNCKIAAYYITFSVHFYIHFQYYFYVLIFSDCVVVYFTFTFICSYVSCAASV